MVGRRLGGLTVGRRLGGRQLGSRDVGRWLGGLTVSATGSPFSGSSRGPSDAGRAARRFRAGAPVSGAAPDVPAGASLLNLAKVLPRAFGVNTGASPRRTLAPVGDRELNEPRLIVTRAPTGATRRPVDAVGLDAHLLVHRPARFCCARRNFLPPLNGTNLPFRVVHCLRGRYLLLRPPFLSVRPTVVAGRDLLFNAAARIVRGSVFWPDVFLDVPASWFAGWARPDLCRPLGRRQR